MMREGDWIIDKKFGDLGTVTNVYTDGVTAKFGKRRSVRAFELIELAPLDIQQEDIASMIDLALMTNDRDWFMELTSKLETISV